MILCGRAPDADRAVARTRDILILGTDIHHCGDEVLVKYAGVIELIVVLDCVEDADLLFFNPVALHRLRQHEVRKFVPTHSPISVGINLFEEHDQRCVNKLCAHRLLPRREMSAEGLLEFLWVESVAAALDVCPRPHIAQLVEIRPVVKSAHLFHRYGLLPLVPQACGHPQAVAKLSHDCRGPDDRRRPLALRTSRSHCRLRIRLQTLHQGWHLAGRTRFLSTRSGWPQE